MVGITNGWPSWTKPRWQISASSRIASIVSRSYAPRSGCRRTQVLALGDATAAIVRIGLLDEPALEVGGQAGQRERHQEEDHHHGSVDLERVDLERLDRQPLDGTLPRLEQFRRADHLGDRAVLEDVDEQAHERGE